jgi:hypothetical protein
MSEENQNQDPKVIKVKVSSEEMTKVLEKNIEKDTKIKELEEKLTNAEKNEQLFDTMREKLEAEFGQENLPIPKIESVEDLNTNIEILKKVKAKESHGTNPSGSAPLNDAQYGRSKQEGSYESYEALIDDLRIRANQGDATAQEQLRLLTWKALKGVRHVHTEPYKPQETPTTTTTDLIEGGKLVVKPDPLGIEKSYRKKKLLERASKGDQTAIDILNSDNY